MSEPIVVQYQAQVLATFIPFHYCIRLYVDGIPTGVQTHAWGMKRATHLMEYMVRYGNELVNEFGEAAELSRQIREQRREEAVATLKVGDMVRLLVDIGQFKKGRVCKVVEISEPDPYDSRGESGWDDDKYPIKVLPMSMAHDKLTLGPKDSIPLLRGEFGPANEEIE